MKPKRKIDQALLESVRELPCMACLSLAESEDEARSAVDDNRIRSHPHHLISVKAGGPDIAQNVMPLCHEHHRMIHSDGIEFLASECSLVKRWLEAAHWNFCETKQKWTPPFRATQIRDLHNKIMAQHDSTVKKLSE